MIDDFSGALIPQGKPSLEYFFPSNKLQGSYYEIPYDGRMLAFTQLMDILGGGKGNNEFLLDKVVSVIRAGSNGGNVAYASYQLDDVLKRDTLACGDMSMLTATICYLTNQTPILIYISGNVIRNDSIIYSPMGHAVVGMEKDGAIMIMDSNEQTLFGSIEAYLSGAITAKLICQDMLKNSPPGSNKWLALTRFPTKAEIPSNIWPHLKENDRSDPLVRNWISNFHRLSAKAASEYFDELSPNGNILFGAGIFDKVFIKTGRTHLVAEELIRLQTDMAGQGQGK